jgi:hypothetical protein
VDRPHHLRLLILLPPVLLLVHLIEEAPAFMRWLNSIAARPIPEGSYLLANLPVLLITTVLAVAAAFIRRKGPALFLLVWLSYIMFANALFHVAATVVLRKYCPGLITAFALYLPYYFFFAEYLRTRLQIRTSVVAGSAVLASLVVYQQWHTVLSAAVRR